MSALFQIKISVICEMVVVISTRCGALNGWRSRLHNSVIADKEHLWYDDKF